MKNIAIAVSLAMMSFTSAFAEDETLTKPVEEMISPVLSAEETEAEITKTLATEETETQKEILFVTEESEKTPVLLCCGECGDKSHK